MELLWKEKGLSKILQRNWGAISICHGKINITWLISLVKYFKRFWFGLQAVSHHINKYGRSYSPWNSRRYVSTTQTDRWMDGWMIRRQMQSECVTYSYYFLGHSGWGKCGISLPSDEATPTLTWLAASISHCHRHHIRSPRYGFVFISR